MTRQERALQLRDAALQIVQRHGTLQPVSGLSARVLLYRGADLMIIYRTPFQQPPPPGANAREIEQYGAHTAAALHQRAPRSLPYGLDIFCGRKVLNIEWVEDGAVALVAFNRGDWEDRLLAAAAAAPVVTAWP
jgi:hypothetical protein